MMGCRQSRSAEPSHGAQAARLARAANVRALYLTHLSSRYDQAGIEAEARAIFPNATVARDFDRIAVHAA
jgi:ribonuclease Z